MVLAFRLYIQIKKRIRKNLWESRPWGCSRGATIDNTVCVKIPPSAIFNESIPIKFNMRINSTVSNIVVNDVENCKCWLIMNKKIYSATKHFKGALSSNEDFSHQCCLVACITRWANRPACTRTVVWSCLAVASAGHSVTRTVPLLLLRSSRQSLTGKKSYSSPKEIWSYAIPLATEPDVVLLNLLLLTEPAVVNWTCCC